MNLWFEPTYVVELVADAKIDSRRVRQDRVVASDLHEDLPLVRADRNTMAAVLHRPMSKVADHSPGTSEIRVSTWREGAEVVLSVAGRLDLGPGVTPPRRSLEMSSSGDPSGGTDHESCSLGLTLSKETVEAHGGRFRVENDAAGRCKRFIFTLPVAL